ncbi:hypothetical protein PWT90_05265 [Aphanocladium album]|nr:hypothetical protein PWT90_05265 [Aphanocladium album]
MPRKLCNEKSVILPEKGAPQLKDWNKCPEMLVYSARGDCAVNKAAYDIWIITVSLAANLSVQDATAEFADPNDLSTTVVPTQPQPEPAYRDSHGAECNPSNLPNFL